MMRAVWNAIVDRRPAVIARCVSTEDVVTALRFGLENKRTSDIRCGGHRIAGHSVVEGGLMIDVSLMNTVQVDPASRRARVQGGALLGTLDREAQRFGLATTAGNVSHTGAHDLRQERRYDQQGALDLQVRRERLGVCPPVQRRLEHVAMGAVLFPVGIGTADPVPGPCPTVGG
jgi:FAD/FMN-containing dehydrogenase